jgi:hypothetical protein
MVPLDCLLRVNGGVKRPIDSSRWVLPDIVWCTEEQHDRRHRYIIWQAERLRESSELRHGRETARTTGSGRGMLEDFLALEGAGSPQIARFAYRWGPLEVRRVSEYGLTGKGSKRRRIWLSPGGRDRSLAAHESMSCTWNWDESLKAWIDSEPIYVWSYWTRRFSAAIRVWNALRTNKAPGLKDWNDLVGLDMSKYKPPENVLSAITRFKESPTSDHLDTCPAEFEEPDYQTWEWWRWGTNEWFSEEHARMVFSWTVQRWMETAGIGLYLRPSYHVRTLTLHIQTRSLFAGLVLQLAAAVAGSTGYATCSVCLRVYSPTRQPRPEANHYCSSRCRRLGRKQIVADAVRRFREMGRIERRKRTRSK